MEGDISGKHDNAPISHALDHPPLVMQPNAEGRVWNRGVQSFKFEEAWLLWEDCEKVVDEA